MIFRLPGLVTAAAAALSVYVAGCSSAGGESTPSPGSGDAGEAGTPSVADPAVTGPGCDPTATDWTVWVANQGVGIDSVLVLKPRDATGDGTATIATDTLATIPVGRAPHDVAFSPDGRLAYVANLSAGGKPGTVSVIDTGSRAVVATVTAGMTPHATKVTPDGKVAWVANVGGADVTLVDTATHAVLGTVAVGKGPTEVAFTIDGSKAFISNGDVGTVSIVDVAARRVLSTVPTGRGSMGLVITRDGKLAFETEPTDDRVSVLDVATGSVIKVLTLDGGLRGAHGVALSGHAAIVTNATEQSLVFIDTRTLEPTATVAAPNVPQLVAVSPDCTRAYATAKSAATVAVVDIPRRKLMGLIDLKSGSVHGIAVLRSGHVP